MRFFNCFLCVICSFVCAVQAHESILVPSMVTAAGAYLSSLDSAQLKQSQLAFTAEARSDWHYVPKARKGLSWAAMTPEQKHLSKQLFVIAFSDSGHAKAKGVIAGERILWERSDLSEMRNPENYYVTIFGNPQLDGSWGASIEGHHLSANITVIDGQEVVVTPSFFGASPDRHDRGPFEGSRPLKAEADEALKLLAMCDTQQLSKVRISEKPIREIVTLADRKVVPLDFVGLPVSEMTQEQVAQLRILIQEYIGRYRAPIAEDDLQKIEAAGIEQIHFAWSGSTKLGQPMYYRVQGPTFLLEYANVQNNGNHSHSVWRDFENDFGYDTLKQHIETEH